MVDLDQLVSEKPSLKFTIGYWTFAVFFSASVIGSAMLYDIQKSKLDAYQQCIEARVCDEIQTRVGSYSCEELVEEYEE